MKETEVAERYSRALFLAAQESKASLDEVLKGLEDMNRSISTDDSLKSDLGNPLISLADKKSLVRQKLKARNSLLSNFLDLLIGKKREGVLPLILSRFHAQVEESQGLMKASVKSAAALDESAKKEIEKKLSAHFNKKVFIETSVHPELLAGIIVKAGDTVIDGSLSSRLKNLKASFQS